MAVIPTPDSLFQIELLLKSCKNANSKYFKFNERDFLAEEVNKVLYPKGFDKPIHVRNLPEPFSGLLNAYSITRAMIQSNESCNKVWATVELLHALSGWNQGLPDILFKEKPTTTRSIHNPLCSSYDVEFCGGTILPTLYYATLSALLSLMSSFGCLSITDTNIVGYYNLIRTRNGWKLFHRRKFIYDLCHEKAESNWHGQLIQILSGLKANLEHFPPINTDLILNLAEARNQRHYEILGSLNAKYSRGVDEYFTFLPQVLEVIHVALYVISAIHGTDGLAGFSRFKELYDNVSTLFLEYGKTPPELFPISY